MSENDGTISLDRRLVNIERTLSELKEVVLENKLQAKDIKLLEKDIKALSQRTDIIEGRVKNVEMLPLKSKADKWQYIMDYIFKGVVVIVGTLLAAKIGLK